VSQDTFEPFEMTTSEKSHPLWLRLKGHFEDQLRALRLKNDRPQTEPETAMLRGHIKCLRAVLALGEDRPLTGDD
jgi:hypothetical protein